MNYHQQQIADEFWNTYQHCKTDPYFNNSKFISSDRFYMFQDYINSKNPMLVYPLLDYYIDYAVNEPDYDLLVYLLYSPFLWENNAYRYQLSKVIHHIKTNELIAGYTLKEEFDNAFVALAFNKSHNACIAHGVSNSLNLWFYLGSYNLITDELPIDLDVNIHENVLPQLLEIFYANANIKLDETYDYFTVSDALARLAYSIYGISLNKPFKNDYIKDLLVELNGFVQYMYQEANDTMQRYLAETNRVYQLGSLISDEYYEFYKSLFIKYGYTIDPFILPGIIMLTRLLEDVVDYYLANIPFIYRTRSGTIQLTISEYLKIFHCLFGVGTHELYVIDNS